jgi:hypothetical protein
MRMLTSRRFSSFGQKILMIRGCVQATFSDRSGARSERRLFYSWLDPQAGFELARALAEHIDRRREPWESVMVTIRDLPPPK